MLDGHPDEEAPIFLCLGHGESVKYLSSHTVPARVKIIDLSQDFRLSAAGQHDFVYGLPELHKAAIARAQHVANPGCFATGIQLGLLPLAQQGMLREEVHVSAITGSTGAGQGLSEANHFSWRNNNVQVYKAFTHQHLGEIYQSLRQLQPQGMASINFIPFRGNFTRGILSAIYLKCEWPLQQAYEIFAAYYAGQPFVQLRRQNPDLKPVVNTNNCVVYLEKQADKLLVISALDNLIKGASGQAVQNMNLMFGLEETAGLRLKAMAY